MKTIELTAEERSNRHITGPCPACKQTMLLDDELDPDTSYKRPAIGREFECPWCGTQLAIRSILIVAMRAPVAELTDQQGPSHQQVQADTGAGQF